MLPGARSGRRDASCLRMPTRCLHDSFPRERLEGRCSQLACYGDIVVSFWVLAVSLDVLRNLRSVGVIRNKQAKGPVDECASGLTRLLPQPFGGAKNLKGTAEPPSRMNTCIRNIYRTRVFCILSFQAFLTRAPPNPLTDVFAKKFSRLPRLAATLVRLHTSA